MKPRVTVCNGEVVENINKVASVDLNTSRLRLGEVGYPALWINNERIEEDKILELTFPYSLDTYNEMYMDDAVYKGISYTTNYLKKALSDFTIVSHKDYENTEPTSRGKEATEFVEYCFDNIEEGLFPFFNNLLTYVKNGTSIIHKSYTKVTDGEYQGKLKINRLSPRALKSVYKWDFDKDQHVRGFWQDNFFRDPIQRKDREDIQQYTYIPSTKYMLFSHNSTLGNPLGRSVLDSVWQTWKSKRTIANYQNIGVAKNLSGMLNLQVPTEDLNKAAIDPTSPEARSLDVMYKNAALSHKGENAYLVTPSDTYDGSTVKKYSATLMGVEGGSSSIDLTNLLNGLEKKILDCFGCGFITLGNDGGGSFSLAETKTNAFAILLQEHLSFIEDVINRELIPQLLSLNGYLLEQKDMPLFKAGAIEKVSIDEIGKYLQRVAAVGVISKDQDLDSYARSQLPEGPKPAYNKPLPEAMVDETSKSGAGMTEGMPSGQGNATGGGDTSVGNTENV